MSHPDSIAQAFHEAYERLAPDHGYETRKASAVPWNQVPEQNKSLMIAVVGALIETGVIQPGTPHRAGGLGPSVSQRVERPLVHLNGADVHALPPEVCEQIFDWAKANGLDPDGVMNAPIACVTVDPTGNESHLYVTELETDLESEYLTHVRRVPLVEALPQHLVPYWIPTTDVSTVIRHQLDYMRFNRPLPRVYLDRLVPSREASTPTQRHE